MSSYKKHALIRAVITTLLLFGVFTEAGIWTAIAILLIALGLEIHAFALACVLKRLKADADDL